MSPLGKDDTVRSQKQGRTYGTGMPINLFPTDLSTMSAGPPKYRLNQVSKRQESKAQHVELSYEQWQEILEYVKGMTSSPKIDFKYIATWYMKEWSLGCSHPELHQQEEH